jgi:hypothetical protein
LLNGISLKSSSSGLGIFGQKIVCKKKYLNLSTQLVKKRKKK